MTPLKPSEKRLLLIVSIGAFFLLNFFGWSLWSRGMARVNRTTASHEIRKRQLEGWKAAAPEADAKLAWINRNLTAYRDETQREIYLDAIVRNQASENGLKLDKNVPLEPRFEEYFIRSAYTGEVSGSWDAVTKFLWELEDPPELRRIRRATFTFRKRDGADAEDRPDIICQFEVEKFWAKESGTLELDPAAASTPSAPGAGDAADLAARRPDIP